MKFWSTYTNIVKRNCTNKDTTPQDLMYWRDNLFASTLIYLLPLCFIALLPSLYWVYKTRMFNVALVDFLTMLVIFFVAFAPHLQIMARKIIFIVNLYLFSFAILFFVGISGSSLVYLLAGTLFSILVFPTVRFFWPAWINFIFSMLYAVVIYFDLQPSNQTHTMVLGEWIALSMNLVFLSFLFVALMPRLFKGLQSVITKQIELQEELVNEKQALGDALNLLSQKNTELEQFSYIASHDLQEPLRMISGFLTQIENKYNDKLDEKGRQYIHFAVDGAKRMHRIILDLLEYSRAGKIEKAKEKVNLTELFNESKNIFGNQIKEAGAVVVANNLPVIYTHRTLIEQVFQNLMGNALNYRSAENAASIEVSAEDVGSHWKFAFKDNGIGIEPEYFKKIFIIFQRLHQKEEYSGTGIGLAISQKIIEFLGGKIWVESTFKKGSTFYFTILKN